MQAFLSPAAPLNTSGSDQGSSLAGSSPDTPSASNVPGVAGGGKCLVPSKSCQVKNLTACLIYNRNGTKTFSLLFILIPVRHYMPEHDLDFCLLKLSRKCELFLFIAATMETLLLVQNGGEIPLTVNMSLLPVNITLDRVELPDQQWRTVSSNGFRFIVLKSRIRYA